MHPNNKAMKHRCAVVTISDTRDERIDQSGQKIMELLTSLGHEILSYQIIPDDVILVRNTILRLLSDDDIEAIITNGGTGIAKRDVTVEAIQPLFHKNLIGFGELFRYLSFQEIGSKSMLSRAIAGVAKDKIIFALPGSINGVQLAMEKLILPELTHIISELQKGEHS
jgi:molybdopterin adenylyltransferase